MPSHWPRRDVSARWTANMRCYRFIPGVVTGNLATGPASNQTPGFFPSRDGAKPRCWTGLRNPCEHCGQSWLILARREPSCSAGPRLPGVSGFGGRRPLVPGPRYGVLCGTVTSQRATALRRQGRALMPYYLFQWKYKDPAIKAMMETPQDRPAEIAEGGRGVRWPYSSVLFRVRRI